MTTNKEVLFVAAENGALRGGKVGGVADVVRDLPAALGNHGWNATVVTPAYGSLHQLPGAEKVSTVGVEFAGATESVDIWQVPGQFANVRNLVLDHPLFAANGPGQIYFSDAPERPYATDANKFAFLCAAVADWLLEAESLPDAIHLHDWHAAFFCLLRDFSPRHEKLRAVRTVFTIHNLSYQGTRPLRDDESSLETWFPNLNYDLESVQDLSARNCINPMAMAIRLADKISTVSPTYAKEICLPSDAATSFVGGEGLESLLVDAANDGRLTGVLNGCYYDQPPTGLDWPALLSAMRTQVTTWLDADPENPTHQLAAKRLLRLTDTRPENLLMSIGRLVSQKATLLAATTNNEHSALEEIAVELGDQGFIIVLGSGEPEYEAAVLEMAKRNENLLFLRGYSESLADPLYEHGDLFLMPSSFEPCGISQMLAMRAGQPCVVHAVGGLKDTVDDEQTGFVFTGHDLQSQASAFVASTARALALRKNQPTVWRSICKRAKQTRFEWSDSAAMTIKALYEVDSA
jgi:starch synthase